MTRLRIDIMEGDEHVGTVYGINRTVEEVVEHVKPLVGQPRLRLETFFMEASKAQRLHPTWRAGQTYFNVLADLRPDLADQVRGTDLDPFYDTRIAAFMEWLIPTLDKENSCQPSTSL